MLGGERPQRLALQQRGVAGGDDDGAAWSCRRASIAIRTACPVPSCFSCTASTALGQQLGDVRADLLALVADDGDDAGRLDGLHGAEHVADHGAPGDGVQHLHGLRLHAGAAAGGEHDDGEVVHGRSLSLAPARTPGHLWSNDAVSGRTYGGESATDRLARRRRQLLDAGLELFGTAGYRATTVRQLCREAKVSDRYFYEQFDSTEDLLLAVYDECTARLEEAALDRASATAAARSRDLARRGLDAFLAVVESDPRLARVVWFEVLGVSPRVESAYLARMQSFGHLMVAVVGRPRGRRGRARGRARADGHHGGRRGQLHRDDLGRTRASPPTRDEVAETLARFLAGADHGAAARPPPGRDLRHALMRNRASSL